MGGEQIDSGRDSVTQVFFAVGNKIVFVVTVLVVDTQVEQSAQTVLDGID